jgi:coproporphyrinogen III oxidase
MRALQGSFPRLRSRWKWEESDERFVGISLIVYLLNHRANNIDVNQIRTVYWNQMQEDPVEYFGG